MAKRWTRWLWGLPPLGVLGWIAVVNRSDGFSIGPASLPVSYTPVRELGKKPWIDADVPILGRVRIPNRDWVLVDVTPDRDAAGVLIIGPGRNEEKWRIDSVEYPAEGFATADSAGGEWTNYTYVPYAASNDRRQAEIWIQDRWIPVTLPYEPGHAPTALPQMSQRGGPFLFTLSPQPRLSNMTVPRYSLALASDATANLLIFRADFSSADRLLSGVNDSALNPKVEPIREFLLLPGVTLTLSGVAAEAEKVDMKVVVEPRGPTAIVKTLSGIELYDAEKGIIPAFSGIDAIQILDFRVRSSRMDLWVHKSLNKRNFLRDVKGAMILDAVGYRFKRSGTFRFVVSNKNQPKKSL